jgi:hypothetical protein
MNIFLKILGTILKTKANKTLSKEMSEARNDVALIKKLAKNPTQQTILNKLDNVIDNIALELNSVSTKNARQKALLNRLDKMVQTIDKYKDKESGLFSTISTIVSIKLTYLESKSDSLSSYEILDWLNKYKPFILPKDYAKQVQRIRKKALSQKLNTLCKNEGLQWFKQRVDIENMNLVEVNVFFDWYNRKDIPQAQEIVLLGKQKMLNQIQQETTVMELMRTYPWLEKLLLKGETISLVGKGKSGIVLETAKSNTVIKISHSGDTENYLLSEAKNHADFRNAIGEGKRKKKVPYWVHVPDIVQIHNPATTEARKLAYIMDRVDGITLKRWVYLKLDEYRSKLEPFIEQEIRSISEVEFEKLVKRRGYGYLL